MSEKLFRPEAMEKFSSPDHLDKMLTVIGPRDWLWLSALLLLALSLISWSIAGTVPREVHGSGVLDRTKGIPNVVSNVAGVVTAIKVKVGDDVKSGQTVAVMQDTQGNMVDIKAPASSVVSIISIEQQMFVQPGMVIINLGARNHPMEGDIYIPMSQQRQLAPGMPVRCAPTSVRTELYGFLLGEVKDVSHLVSSEAEMQYILHDTDLVKRLREQNLTVRVGFVIYNDPSTPSGLKWSGGKGPPWQLGDFQPADATVTFGTQHPVQLLIPSLGVEP